MWDLIKGHISHRSLQNILTADASMGQSIINTGTLVRGILKKNSSIYNMQQFSKDVGNDKDHCASSIALKTLKDLRSISNNSTNNLLKSSSGNDKDLRQLDN
jgi:hypothetical protein